MSCFSYKRQDGQIVLNSAGEGEVEEVAKIRVTLGEGLRLVAALSFLLVQEGISPDDIKKAIDDYIRKAIEDAQALR